MCALLTLPIALFGLAKQFRIGDKIKLAFQNFPWTEAIDADRASARVDRTPREARPRKSDRVPDPKERREEEAVVVRRWPAAPSS
jgi:hypothetical protein